MHWGRSKKFYHLHSVGSQYDLGACLFQKEKPVTYICLQESLPAECNYAQIEKVLLVIAFTTQKFHQCIYKFQTNVQTYYKQLKSIGIDCTVVAP